MPTYKGPGGLQLPTPEGSEQRLKNGTGAVAPVGAFVRFDPTSTDFDEFADDDGNADSSSASDYALVQEITQNGQRGNCMFHGQGVARVTAATAQVAGAALTGGASGANELVPAVAGNIIRARLLKPHTGGGATLLLPVDAVTYGAGLGVR